MAASVAALAGGAFGRSVDGYRGTTAGAVIGAVAGILLVHLLLRGLDSRRARALRAHGVAAGVGASGGALAGAAIGAAAGPIGVVTGAAVGAVIGDTAGTGAGEVVNPKPEDANAQHHLASGTCAAGGALVGAALGAVAGPVGMSAGAKLGALAGGLAGTQVGEAANPQREAAADQAAPSP